jgi:hypothetical protein
MMRKLRLLERRLAEEDELCSAAPEAVETLTKIGEIYDELRAKERRSSVLERLRGIYYGSNLLASGHELYQFSLESVKPDKERGV